MIITQSTDLESKFKAKKTWSKPKFYSGKGIGFLGLGHIQTSTGPYGTPS
jgi:hypothetical protein